LNNIVIGNA
jgi:casein kinase 1